MQSTASYDLLASISKLDFKDRSVAIIGAGWMARQYATALSCMKVKDVVVISKSDSKAAELCSEFGFKYLTGGYERHLAGMKKMDLVIVATPIEHLLPAAMLAAKHGQQNILIEKPGSLYSQELASAARKLKKGQQIRVAYNRLAYPNLHKLKGLVEKEGGITSCRFTFTEWVHTIDFTKEKKEVYARWGIANSLHVISMAFELAGTPKEMSTYRQGGFRWHPSGSVFAGAGITDRGAAFSYHADWNSAGRWGVEVMTEENAYRLMPLEELYVCRKGSVNWEKVPFEVGFPGVKQGVAEEISVMLEGEPLLLSAGTVSLEKAASFNRVAEKIFGYH
jgi:predicted dehydrogenase